MDLGVSFLAGLITGVAYSLHLQRQVKRFPKTRMFTGFVLRISFAGAVATAVLHYFGKEALLYTLSGFLVGRTVYLLIIGFLNTKRSSTEGI